MVGFVGDDWSIAIVGKGMLPPYEVIFVSQSNNRRGKDGTNEKGGGDT